MEQTDCLCVKMKKRGHVGQTTARAVRRPHQSNDSRPRRPQRHIML